MDRGEFIRLGFRCVPAINGGWMLSTYSPDPGEISDRAAFSTFAEMIAWLQEQHEALELAAMEAKHPMVEAPPTATEAMRLFEEVTKKAREVTGMDKPDPLRCTCPAAPFPPRPGCPIHGASDA